VLINIQSTGKCSDPRGQEVGDEYFMNNIAIQAVVKSRM
jgi:hypothetical protein